MVPGLFIEKPSSAQEGGCGRWENGRLGSPSRAYAMGFVLAGIPCMSRVPGRVCLCFPLFPAVPQ